MAKQIESFFLSCGMASNDAGLVASRFKEKKFKKGELFVKEGIVNNQMAFIKSGLLQYFFYSDGVEKTTYITGENTFAVSLVSFLKVLPSKENIRAITDTECFLMSKDDLDNLKETNLSFRSFYINMLEQLIICVDESRFKLMTYTAEQRYLAMMKDEPRLLQQIPLQYLASILGVTPRHLSRIRAEIP